MAWMIFVSLVYFETQPVILTNNIQWLFFIFELIIYLK